MSSGKIPSDSIFSDIGERVREPMGGAKQREFADAIGISPQQLNNILRRGGRPSLDLIERIVSYSGISVEWLLTGRGPKKKVRAEVAAEEEEPYGIDLPEEIRQKVAELARAAGIRGEAELQKMAKCAVHFISGGTDDIEIDDEYVSVPLLSDAAAAGSPAEIHEDDVEGRCVIYRGALRNPDHTTCVWVRGDSMEPILPNGSIVAVNHVRTDIADLDGKVVAAYHEEGVTIKRLMLADQAIILMPENRSGHTPITFDFDEDRIIGACEWAWIDLT